MFVGALAAGLLSTALAARGQQVKRIYRIGVLEAIPDAQNAANLDALRRGLRELGYVEGKNLIFEYRSADGHSERFPELLQTAKAVHISVPQSLLLRADGLIR